MGHIIDPWSNNINPERIAPALIGCINCGMTCPWTNETDPPLTLQIGELWFEAHQQICKALDRGWGLGG